MVQLQVGDVLESRYRIDHPIARGGMSTVYRCVDLRLGRAVAAKVMSEHYVDDPIFRQRFRREARAMAQLSHPNLVNVYDFGSDGDQIYLVMELIRGGTLRELLAERGPMPPHAATAVLRSLLTGLSVAHAAGMVHRDIKPDNVLINDDSQVKLADFGLVRAASRDTGGTDQIVGTVAYLSPEQVEGTEIGPESDVYSAGILLFELLTGATPFHGETDLAHAYHRLDEDVPAPGSRIEGVPQLFDELVGTATARDPADRFTDAAEFLAALEDIAADLQLPVFNVPVPRNAAAHRAAAVPTDTSGIIGPLAPTGVIEAVPNDPAEPETKVTSTFEEEPRPAAPYETSVMPAQGPVTPVHPEPSAPLSAEPREVLPAERAGTSAAAPVSNRSRVKLVVWLTVVALLTAAVAVGGWWFGSGRYGEIPQVLGMDRIEAAAMMEEAGFDIETQSVYHDEIPDDQVAGTEPDSGDRVVRGDTVTVLVSLGQPTVPGIPQDRNLDALRSLLDDRTLELSLGEPEYSDDVAEGGVLSIEPAPGQTVPTNTTVTVALSQGPAPVSIPPVADLPADEARAALEQAGLTVSEVSQQFDDQTPPGQAIGTSPAAGTTVARGAPIVLQISNAIVVPDVLGMSRDEALELLTGAGLNVAEEQRDEDAVAEAADHITAVSPAPGELVDPAAPSVSLTLPGQVEVPGVLGRRIDEARETLAEAGLSVVTEDDDDARIYRQRPRSGDEVTPGTEIELRAFG